MEKRIVPLSRLWIDKNELKEVKKVLDTGWLTKGPKNTELEKLVSEYLGIKHVICTSSCTTSLHLALVSLGIKSGDEVLVADYTYPATGHSVIYCGATPVFVDVNEKTYNIDYNDMKKKFNKEKTKAIIIVHTFGQSCDMNKIMKFANKYNVPVIEDAACALGSKYKGTFCGTIGKIGCFSMHATKGVSSGGEGGLLVTNDDEIAAKARSLGAFGLRSTYEREISKEFNIPVFESIGFNYKMSDVAAAVGIAQFKKLDKIIKKKNALARYWNKKLKEIDYINSPYVKKGNVHNYQGYSCLVNSNIDRNKLIQLLKDNGIQTQIGTYSSYIQPCYNNENDNCVVSLDVYSRSIRFPLFYKMSRKDIDYIIEVLKLVKNDVLKG
jgi:dTDP-4-amino-4,6-dideoxygalactose transaminase